MPAAAVRSAAAPPDADRCPGVLRLTESADGFLARIRVPGGLLLADQLLGLARAAEQLGDGRLELTSRGNVQIRGLRRDDGEMLFAALERIGLDPSDTHDQVRNIVASPLAGLVDADDLARVVRALDDAIRADERLPDLSGRFLFGLDRGAGDIAAMRPDVLAVLEDGGFARVNGLRIGSSAPDIVRAMIQCAHAFLDERAAQSSGAWRVSGLADGPAAVRRRLAQRLGLPEVLDAAGDDGDHALPAGGPCPAGLAVQRGGGVALVVAVPLGRLDGRTAAVLASLAGPRGMRVTPWRTVVIPDADPNTAPEAARAVGLGVDDDTPWALVSACAGRPGCASALADVQLDARAALTRFGARRVHWSGCARRCGRPASTEVDVVATESGYQVDATASARADHGRGSADA